MAYQIPSFADLYKPYNQTTTLPLRPGYVNPNPPPAPTPPPTVDPFQALLTQLLTPTPATPTSAIPWKDLLASTQPGANDVVGMTNRLTGLPSYYPGSQSPFNTGFFNKQPVTY